MTAQESSTGNTEPINLDSSEAERLTGLSAKTLGRLADAGEPIGRIRVGRRVLYHRATLDAWFKNRATPKRQPAALDCG